MSAASEEGKGQQKRSRPWSAGGVTAHRRGGAQGRTERGREGGHLLSIDDSSATSDLPSVPPVHIHSRPWPPLLLELLQIKSRTSTTWAWALFS